MDAIIAHNLGKTYRVTTSRSTTFKELVLKDIFKRHAHHTIDAVKDISFQIRTGRTVGIIGGNGSGKSTLLRLIAGITEPSRGTLECTGTVAAILDLGVGFHPELSGLENIYLQAAVSGITQRTIDDSLDDIIDFADIRRFLYMPLKSYSSGMQLRLGFSIAINVNPDILLVDEVLAVGDTSFQRKSFEKIQDLKRQGKTIVFVTHNLDQAEMLCEEVIRLEHGEIRARGDAEEVVTSYVRHAHRLHSRLPRRPFHFEHAVISTMGRYGSGEVSIEEVVLTHRNGTPTRKVVAGEPFSIEVHYTSETKGLPIDCQVGIGRLDGAHICLCRSEKYGNSFTSITPGGSMTITFDPMVFQPGKYLLSVSLCPPGKHLDPYDMQLRMYNFTVEDPDGNVEALRPATRIPARIKHHRGEPTP